MGRIAQVHHLQPVKDWARWRILTRGQVDFVARKSNRRERFTRTNPTERRDDVQVGAVLLEYVEGIRSKVESCGRAEVVIGKMDSHYT